MFRVVDAKLACFLEVDRMFGIVSRYIRVQFVGSSGYGDPR